MADSPRSRDKRAALRRHGCLHRHPERVRDERFINHEFFDPEDLVQVKYEMLRRVPPGRRDGAPGGRGLLDCLGSCSMPPRSASTRTAWRDWSPTSRGRRRGTSLPKRSSTSWSGSPTKSLRWAAQISLGACASASPWKFIHAVLSAPSGAGEKKTLRAGDENCSPATNAPLLAAYERLREEVLALGVGASGLCGLGVFLQQGMMGWYESGLLLDSHPCPVGRGSNSAAAASRLGGARGVSLEWTAPCPPRHRRRRAEMELTPQKVTAKHLQRTAYLYVRQSSLQQVLEHTEGRQRQYQLLERALRLGWPEEQIVVIDNDQGQSGASADRAGFQHLVAEVGLGHAGIVMGLEVSRLARNSTDWHRLLEICALTETLILDEVGLYDPQHFNDRLLLGLKGTMSEAELHMIRARLQGGLLTKARRGELRTPLPVGFGRRRRGPRYAGSRPAGPGHDSYLFPHLSPRRLGHGNGQGVSPSGDCFPKIFRAGALDSPGPSLGGTRLSERPAAAEESALRRSLFFRSGPQKTTPERPVAHERKFPEQWVAFLPQAHEGDISLEDYEENQRRLTEKALAVGARHRRLRVREGPALLQGLAICGRCGRRRP